MSVLRPPTINFVSISRKGSSNNFDGLMRDEFEVVAEPSPTQSIQGLAKWTDSDPYAKTLQLFRSKHLKNSLPQISDVLVVKCTEKCDCVSESALLASPSAVSEMCIKCVFTVDFFNDCISSFSSVDVNASIDQGPHQNVGEKVFKNESGDQLLFVEEVNGVCGGSLSQVVEA